MSKKAHIYIKYNNVIVLKYYLDIIKKSLEVCGYSCDYVDSLSGLSKKDLFVFPMAVDAFKFYHRGYKNYILWQQGATADESFMRNKSQVRYDILNYIDTFVMKKAKMIFFCSHYMMRHYEKIANEKFEKKSYLMPCYNEEIDTEIISEKDYTQKIFAYVGSLDLWQCFDETIELYKAIENQHPDAKLKVLTFSVEEAKKKIEFSGIKNYSIKCVGKDEVKHELADVVYGFIIRKDSVVNRVATPTKLSSYLSVGVIPIFSSVLDDFSRVSKHMNYSIPIHSDNNGNEVIKKIDKQINKYELLKEYQTLFETYYGTNAHIKKISELARGVLNE